MSSLPPGTDLGGYRIDAVIGRGGMGVVYRARHLRLNRVVALKVIAPEVAQDPDFRGRFERECHVAASIHHPNVVTIHDAAESNGELFIVMHYVDGIDLRTLLKQEGRLEPSWALELAGQVAAGLDAAHRRGVVHRDVKPGNVLVAVEDGTSHAYLGDFGLGKSLSSAGLTRTGMWVGTIDYVAPEVLEGRGAVPASDVYSFGAMLFEVLTGRVPFPRESDIAKMWAHVSAPPPSLADAAPALAPALEPVLHRAMAKAPPKRYGSSSELVEAARDALGASGTGATTEPRRVQTVNPERTEPAAAPTRRDPAPEPAPAYIAYNPQVAAMGPERHGDAREGHGASAAAPPPRPSRPPQRRRGGLVAAIIAGAVALLAAGAVGVLALTGGSDDKGPSASDRDRPTETDAGADSDRKRERGGGANRASGVPVDGRVSRRTATRAGPRLRRARERRGFGLASFSQRLHKPDGTHFSPAFLASVERGAPAATQVYLRAASVLGTSADAILGTNVRVAASAPQARRAGPQVRNGRDRRGLGLPAFSQTLHRPDGTHYSPGYLAGLERGRRGPTHFYLGASELLGLKPSRVLGTKTI